MPSGVTNTKLGASKKEQKRAGRQGPPRYLAVAVLEGKASVCTT